MLFGSVCEDLLPCFVLFCFIYFRCCRRWAVQMSTVTNGMRPVYNCNEYGYKLSHLIFSITLFSSKFHFLWKSLCHVHSKQMSVFKFWSLADCGSLSISHFLFYQHKCQRRSRRLLHLLVFSIFRNYVNDSPLWWAHSFPTFHTINLIQVSIVLEEEPTKMPLCMPS